MPEPVSAMGLPNLGYVPADVLTAMFPYLTYQSNMAQAQALAQLGEQGLLQRAQIAAGSDSERASATIAAAQASAAAQEAAARIGAAGGIEQQRLGGLAQLRALAPTLQMQTSVANQSMLADLATKMGSGQLRDAIAGRLALYGQGAMPGIASALNGMPSPWISAPSVDYSGFTQATQIPGGSGGGSSYGGGSASYSRSSGGGGYSGGGSSYNDLYANALRGIQGATPPGNIFQFAQPAAPPAVDPAVAAMRQLQAGDTTGGMDALRRVAGLPPATDPRDALRQQPQTPNAGQVITGSDGRQYVLEGGFANGTPGAGKGVLVGEEGPEVLRVNKQGVEVIPLMGAAADGWSQPYGDDVRLGFAPTPSPQDPSLFTPGVLTPTPAQKQALGASGPETPLNPYGRTPMNPAAAGDIDWRSVPNTLRRPSPQGAGMRPSNFGGGAFERLRQLLSSRQSFRTQGVLQGGHVSSFGPWGRERIPIVGAAAEGGTFGIPGTPTAGNMTYSNGQWRDVTQMVPQAQAAGATDLQPRFNELGQFLGWTTISGTGVDPNSGMTATGTLPQNRYSTPTMTPSPGMEPVTSLPAPTGAPAAAPAPGQAGRTLAQTIYGPSGQPRVSSSGQQQLTGWGTPAQDRVGLTKDWSGLTGAADRLRGLASGFSGGAAEPVFRTQPMPAQPVTGGAPLQGGPLPLSDVNNIPALQMLRSGNILAPFGLGAQYYSEPGLGVTNTPAPYLSSGTFSQMGIPEQEDALQMWEFLGIPRMQALNQIAQATPGYRTAQPRGFTF